MNINNKNAIDVQAKMNDSLSSFAYVLGQKIQSKLPLRIMPSGKLTILGFNIPVCVAGDHKYIPYITVTKR